MSEKNRKKSRGAAVARIFAIIGLFIVILGLFALGLYYLISAYLPSSDTEQQGENGHFTFTEYVGTVDNPGIGYTRTVWYNAKPNETPVLDVNGDIVLFFIDIGKFSSGVNGTTDSAGSYIEGVDYDLDETFFNALRATFENCRNNGSTVAVRFRYDANGKDDPEPKSFDAVLNHISQIKNSRVLDDYKDILMFVESGFVGKWGEQHGGKYTSLDYKAQLLCAMLDCVPSPVPVTVRTPDTFARYVGITRAELGSYTAEEGSDAARVGLYNDGYMGSNSDLGTFSDREAETTWLNRQTFTSYYGGEFSGNIDFAKQYDAYLPENCIPEMYKTHLSYINGNIFQLYKDYGFNGSLDVGIDNSAYYGKTVFDFIRDHLGYRFVLKESDVILSETGTLNIKYSLLNNGFANAVKRPRAEILLEKDGRFVSVTVDTDVTKWFSGRSSTENLSLTLPNTLESGRWNVYLKFSYGNNGMDSFALRSIEFANNDVYNESLGANRIGYFDLDASVLTDGNGNMFGEVGNETPSHFYALDGKVIADGKISSDKEWTESDLIAGSDGVELYVKADENNLYVMSTIGHGSASPVFNIRATVGNDTYWIYKQSNGYIYFNKEGELGHIGVELGYSDGLFEYKIPFKVFRLNNGSEIQNLSVFVQDSADAWKSKGSISAPYVVKSDFTVYNSYEEVTISAGERYSVEIETDVGISEVEWFLDGKLVSVGRELVLTSLAAKDGGTYSARITTSKGNTKEVDVVTLQIV